MTASPTAFRGATQEYVFSTIDVLVARCDIGRRRRTPAVQMTVGSFGESDMSGAREDGQKKTRQSRNTTERDHEYGERETRWLERST